MGCSPWGRKELDRTARLHFHFSLSCIGGGNGNPLQRSCLENPRDGGAWWAAVYGVTQSRTRLKQLSSSSSSRLLIAVASLVVERRLRGTQPSVAGACGSVDKESACNAGDLGSVPGLGRSPGEWKGYPLQYSGLENLTDRRAWWATVQGVSKSRTQLSN